jgi:ketosteroid isomerase-like protein
MGMASPGHFLKMSTNKEMAMKKSRIGLLLVLISLMCGTLLRAQQSDIAIEKTVKALEQKWLQSQKTSNSDLLAPLLADRFVDTGSEGAVTGKAEALALIKTMKFESAEYYDVKVTVFGNTAIATGGFKGKGTDTAGKPLNVNERWTDTWVRMPNGQWQCVASHASPIKS